MLALVVADSEVGTELFSLAALSLGAVFVGTGNNSVAETICNALSSASALTSYCATQ